MHFRQTCPVKVRKGHSNCNIIMWKIRARSSFLTATSAGRRLLSSSNKDKPWLLQQSFDNGSSLKQAGVSLLIRKSGESPSQISVVATESKGTEERPVPSNLAFLEKPGDIVKSLVTHFLPRGYPQSVTAGYLHFAGFNAISAVLSSAGGVLSMQTLLYSLGLSSGGGVASTLPLAATLNWILKDGLGQAGTILFASFINNRFDRQPKQWRFLASMSLEVSNVIEITTAFFPQYFLPIAAVANMGKNISFLASSASRAAIHRSFAREENLADITAKTGSQNILSSLAGTSLGVAISTYCGNDLLLTCTFFSVLSSTSLVFTYLALRYATITALTQDRLDYVLRDFFSGNNVDQRLLSPEAVKKYENMFVLPPLDTLHPLKVNPSLTLLHESLASSKSSIDLQTEIEFWQSVNPHLLLVPTESNVMLYFDEKANLRDVLQGFVWAYYLRKRVGEAASLNGSQSLVPAESVNSLKQQVTDVVEKLLHMPDLEVSSENVRRVGSHWVTSAALLESTDGRTRLAKEPTL